MAVPTEGQPDVGTYRALLASAHDALRTAVAGVGPADWGRPTPCVEWTTAQVLQHAAGDQRGYALALTGEDGPDDDPFAPSGRLDGDPEALADAAVRVAAAAWATVDDDAAEAAVPVPPGRLPVWLGLGACALDAGVHAWDLAVATGQPSPLTVSDARLLAPVAYAIVEPLRAYGVYAEALAAQPGDDDLAALLRYLGRRPDWTA